MRRDGLTIEQRKAVKLHGGRDLPVFRDVRRDPDTEVTKTVPVVRDEDLLREWEARRGC